MGKFIETVMTGNIRGQEVLVTLMKNYKLEKITIMFLRLPEIIISETSESPH